MNAVIEICQAVGRKKIAARLGVGATAVSNAVVAGVFPASWFAVISDACKEAEVECPREAFNWKIAEDGLPPPPQEAAE